MFLFPSHGVVQSPSTWSKGDPAMSTLFADPVAPATPPLGTKDEALYEIIDGQEVELPPDGAGAAFQRDATPQSRPLESANRPG
jgi:hypothetical protein